MKRSLLAIGVVFFVLAVAGCEKPAATTSASTPAAAPADTKLQGSSRMERAGWIYVHLEGAPEQLGYQHGALLAKEIADLLRVMKPLLKQETKRDWTFFRESAEKMLWPKMPCAPNRPSG